MSKSSCLGPESITLYSQRNFADVIKLKILKWGDYFRFSWQAQCNQKKYFKDDSGIIREEEGYVMTEMKGENAM